MRFVLLLAAAAAALSAQPAPTACSLSPAIEKAVRALPASTGLSLSWEERIAPRRALAEKETANWPLQFLLQDAIRRPFHLGREWDRALALYRRLPDRNLGDLLEARLITPFHRQRSRQMIDRVLQAVPDSPWPHLAAAEWAAQPIGRDVGFGSRAIEEFRRLCPQDTRAFALLDLVQDPERMSRHVLDLRKILDAQKRDGLAESDLPLFRIAWQWEKIAATGELGQSAFERTVRADLETLRTLRLYRSPDWYFIVRHGYQQILKDASTAEALDQEIRKEVPLGQVAWMIEEQRSFTPPSPTASPEERTKSQTARNEELRARLQRFGDQPFTRSGLYMLLFNPSAKLENAEVEQLADRILRFAERYPDQAAMWPPLEIMIADTYARRNVRMDRVPGLVQKGLEEIEYQEKNRRDSDALPQGMDPAQNTILAQNRAREVLLRHAIATGHNERAQAMLAEMRQKLEQTKSANDGSQAANAWQRQHAVYLSLAKLAGLNPAPVAEVRIPKPEESERFPVADFSAKDLSGRLWRLADLKGKVVYLNIWTTWCGPCRAEMPGIQQLHQRWKDRKDRVVLTISADAHESLARDFLRENKYSFAAIHGSPIAEKFYPPVVFPQNWIIDPSGRRVSASAPPADVSTLPQIEQLADKIAASTR